MGPHREAAAVLADHCASLGFGQLPEAVRDATKRSILDTLGVAIAASTQAEGYEDLIALVREAGGREESTVLGFGGRVPAPMAALANGALARALMFDDYHVHKTHPSSATVSAALAVAERLGSVSGPEFVTAIALGNDIVCRMGLSIPLTVAKGGWLVTDIFGVFGASAACGRLLSLDPRRMQSAFGIALYGCAGTREGYGANSASGLSTMMQSMSTGFRSQAAVLAALMASKGITGPAESLEGRTGLYEVYFGGRYDRNVLLGDLGTRFEGVHVGFKAYPGTWHAHPYVDAVLKLARMHRLAHHEVRQIIIRVTEEGLRAFLPLEVKRRPVTSQDANHSIPYLVSVAAIHGRVGIGDLRSEGYTDPAALELAQRVVPVVDERLNRSRDVGPGESGPGRVEIRLVDGRSFQCAIDVPYGHDRNPIGWRDLTAKFRECVAYSRTPVEPRAVDEIISMVQDLERVPDMRHLTRPLS